MSIYIDTNGVLENLIDTYTLEIVGKNYTSGRQKVTIQFALEGPPNSPPYFTP